MGMTPGWLDNFAALAAAHIADRDRLRGELAKTR
jgi:hypothetical protein